MIYMICMCFSIHCRGHNGSCVNPRFLREEQKMKKLIVDTCKGQVKGEQIGGISVWWGIPYAAAPIGKRRFQPPAPCEKWEGIYDATAFGPVAVQPENGIMGLIDQVDIEASEDCLNLNIWSSTTEGKGRPVMRSEEHTSELQSRGHLVCRLLLEK